jgi:hypothetical protein
LGGGTGGTKYITETDINGETEGVLADRTAVTGATAWNNRSRDDPERRMTISGWAVVPRSTTLQTRQGDTWPDIDIVVQAKVWRIAQWAPVP